MTIAGLDRFGKEETSYTGIRQQATVAAVQSCSGNVHTYCTCQYFVGTLGTYTSHRGVLLH